MGVSGAAREASGFFASLAGFVVVASAPPSSSGFGRRVIATGWGRGEPGGEAMSELRASSGFFPPLTSARSFVARSFVFSSDFAFT